MEKRLCFIPILLPHEKNLSKLIFSIVGSVATKGEVLKKLSVAVLVFLLSGSGLLTANASSLIVEKKFSNCADLNKVYPGGVAKSAKSKNKGGEIKNKPVVNAKVYNENASRDRDKDGIACEN
jgi:hypothetical protein